MNKNASAAKTAIAIHLFYQNAKRVNPVVAPGIHECVGMN